MPISLQCPKCAKTYTVPDDLAGRSVRCKQCGGTFVARPTLDGDQTETRKSRPATQAGEPFPSLPAEFGRYRVLRLLGRGGMGSVYLAEDSQLGRQVALKLPSFGTGESPQRVERFVREARSAAVLQHPNICTIFDAGQLDGRPFLTMAFIEGKPLEEAIDPESPMPQEEAARIARKVALALAHAHGKGVVHRDLKPANVMLDAGGEPFVMDFGLAKRVSETDAHETKLTQHGTVLGTPSYMAPEQVRSQADQIGPATDVYALGVILFQLLTGRTPYGGPIGVVMAQILAAPVPPVSEFRPDVDPRLEEACRRAMAKNPADRFPSMAVFAKVLDEYLRAPEATAVSVINVVPVGPMPLPLDDPAPSPFGELSEETTILPTGRRRAPEPEPEERPTRSGRYRKSSDAGGRNPVLIGAGVGLLVLVAILVIVLRPKRGESPPEQKGEVAGPPAKQPGGTIPKTTPPQNTTFFNGRDLTGWVGLKDAWRVVDGAIVGKLPEGWSAWSSFLCSQREYKDFELKFRVWLKYGIGSSGVQVRSKLIDPADYVVSGPQVQINAKEYGGVFAERTGLGWMKQLSAADVKRLFKANEFNDYTIRAVGKRLTVILNGETIVDEVFSDLADSGIIAFQLNSVQKVEEITFKDIEFRELNASTPTGWQPLFNGKDLTGWTRAGGGPPGSGWQVRDGSIFWPGGGGNEGSDLWTRDRFGDFELELEYKTDGNSGVWIRADAPADRLVEALEIQIDKPQSAPSKQSTGAIYGIAAPSREVARANDWNTMLISARGFWIDVSVNGQAIQNVYLDHWTVAGQNPDGSTNRLKTALRDLRREGHIGLQAHSGTTSFRSIRVRRIETSTPK